METSNELAKRFKEVYLDGKWIANTNFKDLLCDITLDQANRRVKDLNSIALLTNHVNYYLEGILEVFKGNPLTISDKKSFDFDLITTETDWEDLKTKLNANATKFYGYVDKMSNTDLNAVFVDEKYGNYKRNIEGVIEHSYYHLGQILLLKKLTS